MNTNGIIRTPFYAWNTDEKKIIREFFSGRGIAGISLYLSSPSLLKECKKYKSLEELEAVDKKLYGTLRKYAQKSKFSTVPFGFFGSSGRVDIVEPNTGEELEVDEYSYFSKIKIDGHFLCGIVTELLNISTIHYATKYMVNNTLIDVGNDKVAYTSADRSAERVTFFANTIDKFEGYEKFLDLSKEYHKLETFVEIFINLGYDKSIAFDFVNELISGDILRSELNKFLFLEKPASKIIHYLNGLKIKTSAFLPIKKYLLALSGYTDEKTADFTPVAAEQLEYLAKGLITNGQPKYYLYGILERKNKAKIEISTAVRNDINRLTAIFSTHDVKKRDNFLTPLIKEVIANFDNQFVPLTRLLNLDNGILTGLPGFGAQRSEKFEFLNHKTKLSINKSFSNLADWIIGQAIQNDYKTKDAIDISSFLDAIPHDLNQTSNFKTISMSRVSGVSGQRIRLIGFHGKSVEDYHGRFIDEDQFDHTQAEDTTNLFFYDDTRSLNVLPKRSNQSGDILYYSLPADDKVHQTHVGDLFVRVSTDNKLLLYTHINGDFKRIIPKVRGMHNYMRNGTELYKLLCKIEEQYNSSDLFLSSLFRGRNRTNYLPRITYNNLIIVPATWQLPAERIEKMKKLSSTQLIKSLCDGGVPKSFVLIKDESRYLLSYSDPDLVKLFFDGLKGEAYIEEFLKPGLNDMENEVLIENSLYTPPALTEPDENILLKVDNNIASCRKQENWAYIKMYCSISVALRTLPEISAFFQAKQKLGQIDCWFFVQYEESGFHLRIRFRATSKLAKNIVAAEMNSLLDSKLEAGYIRKLVSQPYYPEFLRFGNYIGECENIFWIQSEITCRLISTGKIKTKGDSDFFYSIAAVSCLLDSLAYKTEDLIGVLEDLEKSYLNLASFPKAIRKKVNLFFRQDQERINEALMTYKIVFNSVQEDYNLGIVHLRLKRSTQTDALVKSLAHMVVNRTMFNHTRAQEGTVYYFLRKHILSEIKKKAAVYS